MLERVMFKVLKVFMMKESNMQELDMQRILLFHVQVILGELQVLPCWH